MLPIQTINYFLLSSLVAIIIAGSFLILRYRWNSAYQRFLVSMYSFWAIIMLSLAIVFNQNDMHLNLNDGVMNLDIILLGIPCFLTIVSYPAVAMNSGLLKLKNWILLSSPLALIIAIYFAVHSAAGVDPFIKYSSLEYIAENIGSPLVLLRCLLLLIFVLYNVLMLIATWQVVPIYNRHVKEHFADPSYNVDWVRKLIVFIIIVSCAYLYMALSESLIANTIYLSTVIALFIYITDRSLFHKTFERTDGFHIKWSLKNGWHIVEHKSVDSNKDLEPIGIDIDKWMRHSKAYQRPNLSIDDLLAEFDTLSHDTVTEFFKSKGETFQSYVRRYRIEKACRIIDKEGEIYPKELFTTVGFSHYSSFSRAFSAVMDMSPSEYLRATKTHDE